MNTVEYKLEELPPLSAQRKAELMALVERPDSDIDYSDIPPLPDSFWERAVPSPFYRPEKKRAPACGLTPMCSPGSKPKGGTIRHA